MSGPRRCPECGTRSEGQWDHTLECSRQGTTHVLTSMMDPLPDGPQDSYVITIGCRRCRDRIGRTEQLCVLEWRCEFRPGDPALHESFRDRWFGGWRLIPTKPTRGASGRHHVAAPLIGPAMPTRIVALQCSRCGHAPRVNADDLLENADTLRAAGDAVAYV